MNEELCYQTIADLAPRLRSKEISPVELTRAYLDRIESLDSKINCFITVTHELALSQARTAEEEISSGTYRGPLHGIPFAVKDLLSTRNIRTTWGCNVFTDQVPDYDSAVIERLKDSGAVLLGKLSMSELAGGPPGGAFNGPVHNPWKLDHWVHGSSTGPGACVAAAFSAFAIGSETTASILGPSTACGITGLRPTYGRVSRYGAMPLSWTMDKLGPMARGVVDCAMVFSAIHGADSRDPTSRSEPFHFSAGSDVAGRRIGLVTTDFEKVKEIGADGPYDTAIDVLREGGMVVEEVNLPQFPYREVSRFVWQVEASSVFEPYARSGELKEGLVSKAKWFGWKAAMLIPGSDYMKVLRIRHAMVQATRRLYERYDALIAPLNPIGARPIEPAMERNIEGRPRYRSDLLTLGNLAGLPGVAVPCGFTDNGLPIGLMIVGRPMSDDRILEVARSYQQATRWHLERPSFRE